MTPINRRGFLHIAAGGTLASILPSSGIAAAAPGILQLSAGAYQITFADEFSDATVRFPNAAWTTNVERWGGLRTLTGNNELQTYVDAAYAGTADQALGVDPFSIQNGILAIEAKSSTPAFKQFLGGRPYTSGLLASIHTQTYGYFEISARMPRGRGLWPAFWLVGVGDHGNSEIDIVEVLGHQTDVIYQTVHRPDGTRSSHTHSGTETTDGFHTYGLQWTPESIIWHIDGDQTYDVRNFCDVPMFMMVNLAVGGNWPGEPDASTPFPVRMEVDYVRAYQLLNRSLNQ
ncbi:glycoside hydrolase family 16 protein (plasmid) [Skermanella rosea]|uniref:glycoside hydrolase family 16 protein n=1 Tax=Skermanella rosea TaxID=1817965 RepID=UPI0019345093|nr:glycoside hydrolase family 16 protein [Skermanella rosea]UEM07122.1 glycoside hydrolase family 16 protein [Skermanella rosea]